MKWMIASDIHGSAKYCRRLLENFETFHADRILLLGDILYHGPRNDLPEEYAPKQAIEMLSAYKDRIFSVRGNCDTEVDQMVLPFPVLADYAVFTAGEKLIFATHGHVYNTSHLPPMRPGDILLHGHTHVPTCREEQGILYLNPGSVSIPKEGSRRGFMLWDEKNMDWMTLEGEKLQSFVLL